MVLDLIERRCLNFVSFHFQPLEGKILKSQGVVFPVISCIKGAFIEFVSQPRQESLCRSIVVESLENASFEPNKELGSLTLLVNSAKEPTLAVVLEGATAKWTTLTGIDTSQHAEITPSTDLGERIGSRWDRCQ
jgi:hypothetical protein